MRVRYLLPAVVAVLGACQLKQDVAVDPRPDAGDTDASAPATDVPTPLDAIAPRDVPTPPDAIVPGDVPTPLDVAPDAIVPGDVPTPLDVAPDAMPLTGPADPSLRQLAPMSTSQVTSRRPTLHWLAPPALESLALDLCLDRDCARVVETLHPTGPTARASADLRPGPVYWRLRGRPPGAVTEIHSEVWQFVVPPRSAPVDTSWGGVLDVNLDGYRDVAAGFDNAGANQLFLGGPGGLSATPARVISREPGGSVALGGRLVASAGDVNGDGYGDLLDFDPGGHLPPMPAGSYIPLLRLFLGGPSGLSAAPASSFPVGAGACYAGWRFASSAGDLDGDGYSDVLVTNAGDPFIGSAPLCLLIYRGGPTGLDTTPTVLSDDIAGWHPIIPVAAADFNGDGNADLVTGSPQSGGTGSVRVYLGVAGALPSTPSQTLLARPGDGGFGFRLGVGDINADGRTDLVVSAPEVDTARVYVYFGNAGGLPADPSATIQGGTRTDFGTELSAQGDLDADGYSDLLISSRNQDEAWVVLGGLGDLATAPRQRLALAPGPWLGFGSQVSNAGDIDGDGRADAVVTLSTTNAGAPPGQLLVFPGTATGAATTPSTSVRSADGAGTFGGALTP